MATTEPKDWPWPAAAATGVGSLPGTDPVEATKLVLGELPDLPHLPELPDRGPGADMIGRGAGLLSGLAVDLYAGRWRVTDRPGLDARRTRDLLARDLDALTEAAVGFTGVLKLQAVGPWTLAASLDLPIGGRVLHDHGATRDLADSLAEGLRDHVADLARRVPGAHLLLQVDEPSLPAVLAGQVPTESGLHTLRSVVAPLARSALASIVDAVGVPVIFHCCAKAAPLRLFAEAGASAISIDLALFDQSSTAGLDQLGELLDAGTGLFAGAVPTSGRPPDAAAAADLITEVWNRLGFPLAGLAEQVVVTPACGLAGASPEYARAVLAAVVEAGHRLGEHRE